MNVDTLIPLFSQHLLYYIIGRIGVEDILKNGATIWEKSILSKLDILLRIKIWLQYSRTFKALLIYL